MVDTSVNPGNYNKVKILSFPSLCRKCLKLLFKWRLRSSVNLLIAGGFNLFNVTFRSGATKRFQCSVCQVRLPFFYTHANDLAIIVNSICPNCSSRSRHRGLSFVYGKVLKELNTPVSVLHFAPEPVFYPLFRNNPMVSYKTADLFLNDVDFKEDIQKLNFSDAQYDLVLCNHVIEHVPDDTAALAEMSRVLKPGGLAIITIPGDFRRKRTIYFDHLRYNGHYRDYGLDVLKKMEQHFAEVECVDMHVFNAGPEGLKYGIRPFDTAFICRK